jgi:hypothetical protein
VNGKTISDAVADPKGRVSTLILSGTSDEAMVDELYLAALSRRPTPEERQRGFKYVSTAAKGSRLQDLLWALLNSKAFLYIY